MVARTLGARGIIGRSVGVAATVPCTSDPGAPLRRTLLTLLSATLLAALLPGLASASSIEARDLPAFSPDATRHGGSDRYATAALLAQARATTAPDVILARGDNFPDALAGAFLAGRKKGVVLLTRTASLPQVTIDALAALQAERVWLLGGTAAIGAGVEQDLRNRGYTPVRIGGSSRHETAYLVARAGGQAGLAPDRTGGTGTLRTAIVATAFGFADALAAGPLAYGGGLPILLTDQDRLSTATRSALTDSSLGIQQVIIVGGSAAVSDGVREAIEGLGLKVARVAGADRTATAAGIDRLTREVLDWPSTTVALATGRDFPDALALAPLAADSRAGLLLASSPGDLGRTTFLALQDLCDGLAEVLVAGGEAALSPATVAEARLAGNCPDVLVHLQPGQVPTGGDAGASGAVRFFLGSVCYAIDVSGLSSPATAVHIHVGQPGTAGGVVAPLAVPAANGFVAGCLKDGDVAGGGVTELSEALDDRSTGLYVNLHTQDHPDGALRGDTEPTHRIRLGGEYELDATGRGTGDLDGFGTVDLTVDPTGASVCFDFEVFGLTSPASAAHLHRGHVDENGPALVTLPVPAATEFSESGCVDTDEATGLALLDDPSGHYVNLHTTGHPAGAMRGQLAEDALFLLTGDAELTPGSPPTYGQGDPSGLGFAQLWFGVDDTASSTRAVCIEGAALLGGPDDVPTAAHIHAGRVDQNGPVEVTLPTPGTDGFLDGCVEADRTTVNAIEADRAAHYVNVHSSGYPAGAMRGQLRPDLLAALDGWQALAGSEPGGGALLGSGLGWFFVGAGDTLCTLLDGDRIGAVTQAHIHDAPTGQAGPIAFDLVTPQEGEPLDVLLECGNTARPGYGFADLLGDPNGFYVNLHTDAYPEGAIRGQLEPFPS